MATPSQKLKDAITRMNAEVSRNTTTGGSTRALLVQLGTIIQEFKNAPAELDALTEILKTGNDEEVAAVLAHTPAEDEEVPS